jgi:hypothetical protein
LKTLEFFLNLPNQSNKSKSTKFVLSHIINYHNDINYRDDADDDDGKSDLSILVINNM